MRCLVIHAHPDPSSFSSALRDAATEGLRSSGHHVDVLDLYQSGYEATMSGVEHREYYSVAADHPDRQVAEHIKLLQQAEALIFVYPTWWSGLPAIMKGWLDRTFLPDVAFSLDEKTNKVKPELTNIRMLVGITTTGSPRWFVHGVGNAGRRTIHRTVRLICHPLTRRKWLSMYALDTSSPEDREAFLSKVSLSMKAL